MKNHGYQDCYEDGGYVSGRRLKGPRSTPQIALMEEHGMVPELPPHAPEATLKAYEPSWRDQLAAWMLGDGRASPERRRVVEGLIGSSGLGDPGFSLADATPLGMALDADEAVREGDYEGAALAVIPGAAGKGVKGAKAAKAALTGAVLPFASGGQVAKKAGKAAKRIFGGEMPAIKREHSLFNYDAMYETPDVPQADLPRYEPARGVSARVGDMVNDRKAVRAVEDAVDRGIEMGGPAWYNADELRQRFVGELGEDEGGPAFRRYMDMVAATSPRSRVGENVRNASYYYSLDRQGLPMPGEKDKLPQPYGHIAQKNHKLNAQGVVENGGWDVFRNPKPASFVENLVGNQRPVTVDAHAYKLPALATRDPRFLATSYKSSEGAETVNPRKLHASGALSMEEAVERPAMWLGAPEPNEYAAMERLYQDVATRKGITPAQAQASAWIGGGEDTGLMSATDPFLRIFEERLAITADKTGLSKEDVLRRMIRGEMPLYNAGGYVDHG